MDNESRYRTLLDFATDSFLLHDGDATIVDVNDRTCESLGYTREELIGQKPSLFAVHLTPERQEWVLQQLRDGQAVAYDSVHRRKDGSTFPAEVRIRPISLDGRPYAVTLARDITECKQAEIALRESERRYRLALDSAEIGHLEL